MKKLILIPLICGIFAYGLCSIMEYKQQKVIEEYQQITQELEEQIKYLTNYSVKVTYYVPSKGGINSYGDPNKTATMQKPKPGKTVAVSRDLIHLLYKKIYVKGKGVFYANDLLANSYKGKKIRNQIDICVKDIEDIPRQGVFHNVPIAVKFD